MERRRVFFVLVLLCRLLVFVSDSIFSFFLPQLLASSLSIEGCKRITEGRKKRDEDIFQLKLLNTTTL